MITGDSQGFRDFQLGACLGHALRVHSSVIAARFGVKNIHADFVGAVVCDINIYIYIGIIFKKLMQSGPI